MSTAQEQVDQIRTIVENLPLGYELYAAVGALTSIAEVLGWSDEEESP